MYKIYEKRSRILRSYVYIYISCILYRCEFEPLLGLWCSEKAVLCRLRAMFDQMIKNLQHSNKALAKAFDIKKAPLYQPRYHIKYLTCCVAYRDDVKEHVLS